jgi:hypothetical protein
MYAQILYARDIAVMAYENIDPNGLTLAKL